MTTATRPSSNGQSRKHLSDQLDRLDGILDVLSDGLNEAVATAVENAVGVAVEKVLTELLTNPAVRQLLQPPTPPAPPPPPAEEQGPRGKGSAWAWVRTAARSCINGAGAACDAARRLIRSAPGVTCSIVVAGAGLASAAVCFAGSRLRAAGSAVVGWVRGLATTAGSFLARLLPAFT